MKRIVLCIFSFLLILLVFCTMVSPKAQEEMMTLVETKKTEHLRTAAVYHRGWYRLGNRKANCHCALQIL